MLEKKGVSPVQCQTATNSGNSCGGGAASGGTTPGNTSQASLADNTNGLEACVLPQNRNNGSNGVNLSNLTSASINTTSSGPNTPTEKMGAMSGTQDFVIKSEEQKSVPTNHCDSKTIDTNTIQTQLRNNNNNNNMDSKPNICGNNAINRTNAMNNAINSNNNVKCRDSAMSCPPNGPLNGIRANSTSPMSIDDKLSAYPPELAMPVPTGNLTMPGDVPPLPLMQQSMNMMRMRGPCPPASAQGPQVANHMLGSHPHNNSQQLVANNVTGQKSSATMDSQYMQQQSQIFVFSTLQANRAAEAVDKGMAASIIDFHCSNPETKRLLEKFPLKPQMNRNNSSAVWLNSLAQRQGARGVKGLHPSALKNSFGQPRSQMPSSCVGPCNNMHNSSGLPSGPGPGGGAPNNNWPNSGNMCSNPNASPNWSSQQQQMFAQNFEINSNQKFMNSGMGPNGPINRPCAPFPPNNMPNNPQMFNNYSPGAGVQPHLAGSEIPDENLTPQQKQNRERKLEIIRKMQQQLCPEMIDSPPMGPLTRMPGPNQPLNAPEFMMDQNNMCTNSMCSIQESDHMGGSDPNLNNCMTPSSMMSTQNNNTSQYSQSHTSMAPTSGSEWPKGNYMDDRRRKSQNCGQGGHNNMCNVSNSVPISHPSPLSQPSSALNSPNPCISQSPGSRIPPPPYNQGIRPHSSPHPSSPATGSLPLPSPRMQSPADPSRQQFNSGSQSRLPHTSPSPATPSADSNSSIPGTGVHSPKPLPASSSQTSISTSSTVVQNNSRSQTSTNNVTNMRATTPSNSAPLSSSPSNVKKLPNHMTTKGMSQDCGSDLLLNSLSNSGSDQKPHPNDMLMGPTLQSNCSSPFMCKPEPALMPVPSPQQIQYLNSFEGQELTIQKQPNHSLRDTDLSSISPAPDLDLGFHSEFVTNCQTFGSNERLPNFQILDNMNPRFPPNPQNANMSGHQFDPNQRFMTPDNNQRFLGPVFDGPNPRIPNHENQFRAQNMLCMPYGQMDNNMMRFNSPCDNPMGPRLRPNHPNDMVSSRFPTHPNDSIQSSHQFNSSAMSPMSGEQINLMPFPPNQSSGTGSMPSVNNFNQQMEGSVSSTHLQNLQKMTPPFDIGPPNKVDQMIMSNGPLPHNHNSNNQLLQGSNGSMTPSMASQTQRNNNFDPISSMAAMSESNVNNQMNAQNIMSGPSMNMSGMQVSATGPPPGPPNMVNFHTSMSSMQGMHQNMTPDANGMQSPYGMNPQMNPQMSGGPQTVNNTYVNATMSIQQLNIQNVPTPNFSHNLDQNMNMGGPQQMSGPVMSPPSAAMQMMQTNSSAKMGPNFGHRMAGPTSGPNFPGQQMNNPRGMNPMNFNPSNPHMMQRCSVYNSANIQIKPDAPNTIQYLPPRQQNPNLSNRAPSLDFLNRCEPPLTNLGNKLPTHNLQYFPSNNANMNSSQTMPRMMGHNMPLAAGPGRPMNPSMVRGSNPNSGLMSGQQPMMPTGDMFGRPTGPNNMNGPPNAMFSNMKQSNAGPMSPGLAPDAAQPLPPSMSHSYNNYKQSPFNAVPVPSDPNYAIQFQHFQQQLYATNTNRSSNTSANTNSGNNPRMPGNNFYNSSK